MNNEGFYETTLQSTKLRKELTPVREMIGFCWRKLVILLSGFFLSFGTQVNSVFNPPRSGFLFDIDGISIAPGSGHICVLEVRHGSEIGGIARCWGNEEEDGKSKPPDDVIFVQLASGLTFTCGITVDQTVLCWGTINNNIRGLFTQITASEHYGCGVRTDGNLLCWDDPHRLTVLRYLIHEGLSHVMKDTPKSVDRETNQLSSHGGTGKFVQVSCSPHHCCALDTNAHAHCWGYGRAFGEMLPPTKKNITSIGKVTEFAHIDYTSNVNEIEEEEEGEEEEEEEEGEEEVADEEEDSDDENLDSLHDQAHTAVLMERFQFKQISVGEGFSCGIVLQEEVANLTAVVHEGDLVCWGGHRKHSSMPHHVVGPFKQVSVGSMGVCAIYMGEEDMDMDHRRKGTKGPAPHNMKCWGFITNFVDPKDNAWDQVSIGSLSVCGVTMMSQLECWGTGIHDVKNMPRDIEIA